MIEVRSLKKYFKTKEGMLHAVDDVSFSVEKGETLGLVGESGCGKSTLGRTMIRLIDATSGSVHFEGVNIMELSKGGMKSIRKKIQIVFQDPYSSLNPRMSVKDIIAEPLIVNSTFARSADRDKRVWELMDTVGLARRLAGAYPHELDGGRRQRIGIARALALSPEFIVLDEPVSALDVCIQAQILNLLKVLQKDFGYTYVFISHNLSVVKHVSTRIAVMYLGKIVELAGGREIFKNPAHPYTKALISAIPRPVAGGRDERIILEGDVPSPVNPPAGCRFAGRCAIKTSECEREDPELEEIAGAGVEGGSHFVSCFNSGRSAG
ncbi:MAG: ATP-binding cassette domain-containing protein [Synergistaceae bacterium]|jgi:peptide/nickel transport system ATP-binding protein|nr:ATP-binding cassette domain-containing protein [Synergistaceae bacterium]